MFKLIALDLDGTLTNDKKELTNYTVETLHEAAAKGLNISLVSGRPTLGILPVAKRLELSRIGGYILAYNGGHILDCKTGKDIYKSVFPRNCIEEAVEYAREYNVAIMSYDDTGIVTEGPMDKYVEHESFVNAIPAKRVDSLPDYLDYPFVKMVISGDPAVLDVMEKPMAEHFRGKLDIYRAEPIYLEVMPLGIKKSAGLQRLMDYLNIKKEELMACGDANNDLPMMELAGFSVAVSNAYESVKSAADYITKSNNEDGVAYAVRKFFLNQQ